jgi:solute carrier family 25 (mitochondrial carnitine/acylcarnitine transporter), member 20/29
MASPLAGVAAVNSLLFAVYGSSLRKISSNSDVPSVSAIFAAGCISGFVNGFVSCPIELVKIRLQNQTNWTGGYKGPVDCVRKIVAKQGMRGMYKGFGTTLLRETPSYGGIAY